MTTFLTIYAALCVTYLVIALRDDEWRAAWRRTRRRKADKLAGLALLSLLSPVLLPLVAAAWIEKSRR